MEGIQTLNRDNGVLKPQAKGSGSDTGTLELLDPQVRPFLAFQKTCRKSSLFTAFSYARHSSLTTLPLTHSLTPLPLQPGTPKLKFPPPVSSIPSTRVHPASAKAPPSLFPQTSLQLVSLLELCHSSWTTPM